MTNKLIKKIINDSQIILKGKQEQVELVLCNIFANGHTLIEDAPGVGKTTLVKYIGRSLGLDVSRVQFTNDLLPADILGTSIFNKDTHNFEFHKGPIFGELVLADELNRAPPKTQSALLQAMEERMISIEGQTFELPNYFTVIATQNPNIQVGTFNLPESQLDRFSMKIKMGYPDKNSTLELLKSSSEGIKIDSISRVLSTEQLEAIQKDVRAIHVDDSIFETVYNILNWTRSNKDLIPLSNRCGIDIVNTAKSWALIKERDYVIPDDIHHIFPFVAGHRLVHPENSDIDFEHKMAREVLGNI
ncbi:MAG: MoxR-like ATPase [Bacteriovoracaceae bacterium]|jgi:MoxR-like ATPase